MLIFGVRVHISHIYFSSATLGGLGLCYALYKIFKGKKGETITHIEDLAVVEDLKLPQLLEHDYGNYRSTCLALDLKASAFLNELPERFFKFNEVLLQDLSTHFSKKNVSRYRRALIVGSGTGKLVFELRNLFSQVCGVDPFFSRVITCFRFQNEAKVNYDFPLEGSYRTVKKVAEPSNNSFVDEIDAAEIRRIKSVERIRRTKQRKSSIEFINADIGISGLSLNLGQFQVVIITDEIADTSDPETLLRNVHRYVETGGLLVIYTDYNWKRSTNQNEGFTNPKIQSSFDFLKFMLRGFFDLVDEKNIPDVIGESLRSCIVRNLHVTYWERNSRPILP